MPLLRLSPSSCLALLLLLVACSAEAPDPLDAASGGSYGNGGDGHGSGASDDGGGAAQYGGGGGLAGVAGEGGQGKGGDQEGGVAGSVAGEGGANDPPDGHGGGGSPSGAGGDDSAGEGGEGGQDEQDALEPSLLIAIETTNGFVGDTAVEVELDGGDSGGSGLDAMQFSNDGITWSDWEPFATTKDWQLASGDGEKTVQARVRDGAHNESDISVVTVTLDKTPPTLTSLQINEGDAFSDDPESSLSTDGSDNLSGLEQLCVSINQAEFVCAALAVPAPLALSGGDGLYEIEAYYLDAAGNASQTESADVTLDTIDPLLSDVSIDGGAPDTTSAEVTITLQASDENALEMSFSTDAGVTFGDWLPFESPTDFTLPEPPGAKTLHVAVRDPAGNLSQLAFDSIDYDPPGPSGTLTIDDGASFTLDRTVDLVFASDDSSAMAKCLTTTASKPSADDGCFSAFPPGALSHLLPDADAPYTLYAWFKDGSGTVGNAAAASIYLDRTEPPKPVLWGLDAKHRAVDVTYVATNYAELHGYQVGYSTVSGGPYDYTDASKSYLQTVSGLPNGVAHYFVVRAEDVSGRTGPDSTEFDATPNWAFDFVYRTPGNDILALDMNGADTGVLAGQGGVVYSTTDRWLTRQRRDALTDEDLHGMVRDAVGRYVVVGGAGQSRSSFDGGATWNLEPSPSSVTLRAVTTFHYGSTDTYLAAGDGGIVLRASRPSWADIALDWTPMETDTGYGLAGIDACTDSGCLGVVLAAGEGGMVLRSEDGGYTWSERSLPSEFAGADCHAVRYRYSTNFFVACDVAGAGRLFKSTDLGLTFTDEGSMGGVPRALAAGYDELFIAGGSTGQSGYVHEYDVIWDAHVGSKYVAPGTVFAVAGGWTGNDDELVTALDHGRLFVSSNHGDTWTARHGDSILNTLSDSYSSLAADTSGNVFAIANSGSTDNGSFVGATMVSSNGGASWTKKIVPNNGMITRVAALGGGEAMAVGGVDVFKYTGGAWLDQTAPELSWLTNLSCASATQCVATGMAQGIQLSSGSWTRVIENPPQVLNESTLYFDGGSALRGIVVGDLGTVYTGADQTWTLRSVVSGSPNLVAVEASPGGVALSAGGAALYRSTNHGVTWSAISNPPTVTIRALAYHAPSDVWFAVGNASATDLPWIGRSADDGSSWSPCPSSLPAGRALTTLTLVDDTGDAERPSVWVGGDALLLSKSGGL
jgi:hypothetical protein